MNEKLQTALDNTESTYKELVEIANSIVKTYASDINDLITEATENIDTLSNEQVRQLLLKISLKAYSFGDVKEKAALKAQCAKTLKDEAYAIQFNGAEGSVEAKKNTALTQSSAEAVAETLYNLVSSLFKTKLDEMHRVVDSLKSVLMSRMAEQKLMSSFSGSGE